MLNLGAVSLTGGDMCLLPLSWPADVSGKLRIWDTTQKEHILKYEYQPFAGKIKDIAWTEDSKRIAVVGEGREK